MNVSLIVLETNKEKNIYSTILLKRVISLIVLEKNKEKNIYSTILIKRVKLSSRQSNETFFLLQHTNRLTHYSLNRNRIGKRSAPHKSIHQSIHPYLLYPLFSFDVVYWKNLNSTSVTLPYTKQTSQRGTSITSNTCRESTDWKVPSKLSM